MAKKFNAKDVVREYCKRFTKSPNRTLAKKIYNENPNLYASFDTVLVTIRRIRGKAGDKERVKNVKNDGELYQDLTFKYNPFD